MRFLYFASSVAVIFSFKSLAGLPQRPAPDPKWIGFELGSESALPIVKARLNRSEGYRLALDFSVPDVLLDEFLVAGTGMELLEKGETETIDYYGRKEKVPVKYLDTLEVGGMARQGIRTLVIRGDDLGSKQGIPVYGRIGRTFLDPFRLTVHYPRKLLLLEPSPEGDLPVGGVAFQDEGKFISVDVELNGTATGRLVIDPNATFTMLDKKWAEKSGLVKKGSDRLEIATFRLGDFAARRVPALLDNMRKLPYGKGRKERPAGVIGASLLRDTAVTYDFLRRMVWFRPAGGSP
jgi:hypothetical protein